jgi:hypothetical protein
LIAQLTEHENLVNSVREMDNCLNSLFWPVHRSSGK